MEVEVTSDISRSLALANNLVNGIESLVEDCSCGNAYIFNEFTSLEDLLDEEVEVGLSGCSNAVENLFELNDLIRYGLVRGVRVREGVLGVDYHMLYELAISTALENIIPYMKEISLKTAITGVEYMYIILKSGRALLLEGEANRVAIPAVSATLMIHTHSSICNPSANDLRTTLNLFFDGGLGSGITSPTCYYILFRVGPFTEGDYLTLKSLRKSKHGFELLRRRFVGSNVLLLLG